MHTPQRIAGVVAGLGLAAGSLLATSAPAQAYDNDELTIKTVSVLTDSGSNCYSAGDLNVIMRSDGCYVGDSADGTLFAWDDENSGGKPQAYKWQIYKGRTMVAKVEWHPYGEKIWVYDTANDADGIFVSWGVERSAKNTHVVKAPATNKRIDYTVVDLNVAEGAQLDIRVWDGSKPANNGGSYQVGYDELDGTLVTA